MHAALMGENETVSEAVRAIDPDTVLLTPVADLVGEFYERFRVNPVELKLEERTSSGAKDLTIRIDGWSGRQVNVDGTRVEILIPFSGDAVLLDVRPSTFTLNPPRFEVRHNSIVAAYEGRSPLDNERAKAAIEKLIKTIQQHLDWQKTDIEPWNDQLLQTLPGQIEDRRRKVLADRELDEFLEVPIHARADPARSFAVDPPKRPRPVEIGDQTGTSAFTPEPAISEDGFAAILSEIESVTTAVERLPNTFATMPEESLRDVLLVVLNNRFGPSAGETFSRNGKTDILIPWGGDQRAVFIAECKIWKGPAAFRSAIQQLLGYIIWRDTRAALIVFVRSGSPSGIAEKAEAELTGHDHFKRRNDLDGHVTFTLAHPDDSDREIHVALMVIPVLA